jgi:hypothetical protein
MIIQWCLLVLCVSTLAPHVDVLQQEADSATMMFCFSAPSKFTTDLGNSTYFSDGRYKVVPPSAIVVGV